MAHIAGSGNQTVFQLIVAGAKIAVQLVVLIEGIFLLKGMLDLSQQLARMKRLGQIVVGAAHQGFRQLRLIRHPRDNDDPKVGRIGIAPQRPADFVAVLVRQLQIEQ